MPGPVSDDYQATRETPTKRIPIAAARRLIKEHGCTHVIIYAYDGEAGHVVTCGKSTEHAGQAAEFGNRLKRELKWPESLCADQPSRVRKLQARITELEERLARHCGCSRFSAADRAVLAKGKEA